MTPSPSRTEPSVTEISLHEYEQSPPVIVSSRTRSALIDAAHSGRIGVLATSDPDAVSVRASSWVGALVVPGLTVRVRPKVGLQNLFALFTVGLPASAWQLPAVDWAETEDPVDGIADLVVRAIEAVTRPGLLHGYLSVEQRVPAIRGRLLVEQLARRPWDIVPPPCRFDEFTADVTENRILRLAVSLILRWPRLHPSVRRHALRLRQRFDDVADATPGIVAGGLPISTRLNEHYQPALQLARLVIEGTSFADLPGGRSTSSFMVDMNELFERWVAAELQQRLWPDVEVVTQLPTTLAERGRVGIRPDLVFRRGGRTVLVGDTKYKLTGDGKARSGDYFQLLAYTVALEVDIGLLIYCTADEAPPLEVVVRHLGHRLRCSALRLDVPTAELAAELDRLSQYVATSTVAADRTG